MSAVIIFRRSKILQIPICLFYALRSAERAHADVIKDQYPLTAPSGSGESEGMGLIRKPARCSKGIGHSSCLPAQRPGVGTIAVDRACDSRRRLGTACAVQCVLPRSRAEAGWSHGPSFEAEASLHPTLYGRLCCFADQAAFDTVGGEVVFRQSGSCLYTVAIDRMHVAWTIPSGELVREIPEAPAPSAA